MAMDAPMKRAKPLKLPPPSRGYSSRARNVPRVKGTTIEAWLTRTAKWPDFRMSRWSSSRPIRNMKKISPNCAITRSTLMTSVGKR